MRSFLPHSFVLLSLLSGLAGAAASTVSSDARASTSVAVTITDLARASEAIVRVTPLDQSSAWEDGRIVTTTRVRVDDVIAGAAPKEMKLRALGGVVGGVGQSVEGEATLAPQKAAIVFVAHAGSAVGDRDAMRVVGRAQGRWTVFREGAAREVVRVHDTGKLVTRARIEASARTAASIDGATIEEATREAAHAWSATHAR